MNELDQAAEHIIHEQQNIIGPLALEQARKVKGLKVDNSGHGVELSGDKSSVLGHLVSQYEKLFGQTSVEVCKDAARPFLSKLPTGDVPAILR